MGFHLNVLFSFQKPYEWYREYRAFRVARRSIYCYQPGPSDGSQPLPGFLLLSFVSHHCLPGATAPTFSRFGFLCGNGCQYIHGRAGVDGHVVEKYRVQQLQAKQHFFFKLMLVKIKTRLMVNLHDDLSAISWIKFITSHHSLIID